MRIEGGKSHLQTDVARLVSTAATDAAPARPRGRVHRRADAESHRPTVLLAGPACLRQYLRSPSPASMGLRIIDYRRGVHSPFAVFKCCWRIAWKAFGDTQD
jgi:hypothetical protein